MLFLKLHRDIPDSQHIRILFALGYIARKAGNTLAKDVINLSCQRIVDHPHEVRPFFRAQAGETVRIHAHKLPIGAKADEGAISLPLHFEAVFLFLQFGTHAAIHRNPYLFALPLRRNSGDLHAMLLYCAKPIRNLYLIFFSPLLTRSRKSL